MDFGSVGWVGRWRSRWVCSRPARPVRSGCRPSIGRECHRRRRRRGGVSLPARQLLASRCLLSRAGRLVHRPRMAGQGSGGAGLVRVGARYGARFRCGWTPRRWTTGWRCWPGSMAAWRGWPRPSGSILFLVWMLSRRCGIGVDPASPAAARVRRGRSGGLGCCGGFGVGRGSPGGLAGCGGDFRRLRSRVAGRRGRLWPEHVLRLCRPGGGPARPELDEAAAAGRGGQHTGLWRVRFVTCPMPMSI